MKIYTKTGDKGETSLIGGTRVEKDNIRVEAYGDIDELNANIGMLTNLKLDEEDLETIMVIVNKLFNIGSFLATENEEECSKLQTRIKKISSEDISFLESRIDQISESLPPQKGFVLPIGSEITSWCNISRTVCRRAERRIVSLKKENFVDTNIMLYINRLSDFLFVLGRKYMPQNKIENLFWNMDL
ncbi:MAG: cob(I)yrinic acid a,c-diamide adenosyltransferase [Bacteroidales bacterium]|nr:cob(I)yrinic acid a,c-diamide adenosyltransferase [Bacteroidales bacterium]